MKSFDQWFEEQGNEEPETNCLEGDGHIYAAVSEKAGLKWDEYDQDKDCPVAPTLDDYEEVWLWGTMVTRMGDTVQIISKHHPTNRLMSLEEYVELQRACPNTFPALRSVPGCI